MVHTGGNYMVDGYGTAASTTLVLSENTNQTASSIQSMANNYLGINNYMLIDDPLGDYIEHIDCWGKFLDVDKVLIGQTPPPDWRRERRHQPGTGRCEVQRVAPGQGEQNR